MTSVGASQLRSSWTTPDVVEPSASRADSAFWFLPAARRGNPATTLDTRHADGLAWTTGNQVTPLIHGATYFRHLLASVEGLDRGDLLMLTDWRGDPDEPLDGPDTDAGQVLSAAASRGVQVCGLMWRSHPDWFRYSSAENRRLGAEINDAGGECLLDMRIRPFGSHHQKLVVLRHRDRPEDDITYIGGIDLCHGRRDDERHCGDDHSIAMAQHYGQRPPWHDIQLAIRGPAVGDAELVFRERWHDRTWLTHNPLHIIGQVIHREPRCPRPLPPQNPDPPPCGDVAVQLLRTYPPRKPAYPFAPAGERSIARGYEHALARAERLVFLEDQYLWSHPVAQVFARALQRAPELRLIIVIPLFPEQDGRLSRPPNDIGREAALKVLAEAGGDRFAVYGLENRWGTPIYVHAKACVVDDTWACIGSDNANLRSWTHDSELTAAFVDEGGGEGAVRGLRRALSAEHLGVDPSEVDLDDPMAFFEAFRTSAHALDAWHEAGSRGPRPRGQLRTYHQRPLPRMTRVWAAPVQHVLFDPDGRPKRPRKPTF